MPTSPTGTQSIDQLKQAGNEAYAKNDFKNAIAWYTKGIAQDPKNAVLYSNRSASHLELKAYQKACEDATKAVELDRKWSRWRFDTLWQWLAVAVLRGPHKAFAPLISDAGGLGLCFWHLSCAVKGYFRLGKAQECLGKTREALATYELGLTVEPGNDTLLKAATDLRSKLNKHAFAMKSFKSMKKPDPSQSPLVRQAMEANVTQTVPAPTAWVKGFNGPEQREWLLDVYRMRCSDDQIHGGNSHGLYEQGHGVDRRHHLLEDFFVFCKLAVSRKVLPASWDWHRFMLVACGNLCFKEEKATLKTKWDTENAFDAFMGGRSLRYTGEVVYGYPCNDKGTEVKDVKFLKESVHGEWLSLLKEAKDSDTDEIFGDVGGLAVWEWLNDNMFEVDEWPCEPFIPTKITPVSLAQAL